MAAAPYPDKLIRLIGIPFMGLIFRHIGEPAPLITLLRDPTYYLDVTVCILVLGLLWQYNRAVIMAVDRRYGWLPHPTERIMLQLFGGLGVSLVAVTIISFIYNEYLVAKQRAVVFDVTIVLVTDVPVSFLILLSIHLLYAIMGLQREYEGRLYELRQALATPPPPPAPVPEPKPEPPVRNLMAYQGKSLVPVPLQDIAYLYKANELTLLRTYAGKDYMMDETLEHFEHTLPQKSFFRLNRQMLVHIGAVKRVSADGSGRLLLHLEPIFKEEVYASRRRAPEFQTWLREVAV